MSQPDRIEFITELVTPLAASLGLAVWGVELGGAARPIARIYVDVLPGAEPAPSEKASDDDLLPQGVTIDQCAELSRLAGLALDVEDPSPPTGRSKFPLRGSSAPSSKSTS